jgi:hypothetical protein
LTDKIINMLHADRDPHGSPVHLSSVFAFVTSSL